MSSANTGADGLLSAGAASPGSMLVVKGRNSSAVAVSGGYGFNPLVFSNLFKGL